MQKRPEDVDALNGELIFLAHAMETLWSALIRSGAISPADAVSALDKLLLSLEATQGDSLAGPAAISHACTRIELLMNVCSRTEPKV